VAEGVIIRSLSGFYTIASGGDTVECRARGRFRKDGVSPLVGDRVLFTSQGKKGTVDEILPRRNSFVRPAVANVDQIVILASAVIPVTDPFLIDRVAAIAESQNCGVVICINKDDLDSGDALHDIYASTGYRVIRTSAVTGDGIEELREAIRGKVSAFTGNSGVGKSSVLNALSPGLSIAVGDVSEKLGRGRHTTRHVELFDLGEDTYIADTPGFASFDFDMMDPIRKEELQYAFPEFGDCIGQCRFPDCAHLKEPDCAVLAALSEGKIHESRHRSYARLYAAAAQINDWERK